MRTLDSSSCRLAILLPLILLALPSGAGAAGLEDALNARWRGGFVVVKLAVASSCAGFYNDNDVVGSRANSSARRRFDSGEAAHVDRVDVKRSRIDVFLDLTEGVLEERRDGPFTLYDAQECKVQLKVPVPDRADAAAVEARLADLLELHGSQREAEASPAWNRRRREPYPKDYDQTLAAYQSWKAAQTNVAVQARMNDAIEEAARINDRMRSDPDYLQGFADGVQKGRDRYLGSDCASVLNAFFNADSRSGSADWKRGYEDGQRLAWHLQLLRRLKECFVPVP